MLEAAAEVAHLPHDRLTDAALLALLVESGDYPTLYRLPDDADLPPRPLDGTVLVSCEECEIRGLSRVTDHRVPVDPVGGGFRRIVPKEFYVSPFSDLDLRFDFRLRTPTEDLDLAVDDLAADGSEVLISRLEGRRLPLTDGMLLRLTARYPLVTLRVITLIHWHALRLWARRVPWHRKADRPEAQRGVLRPGTLRHAASAPVPPISS